MRTISRNLLLTVLACTFVLLALARCRRLDRLTLSMPHPIRAVVATIAVHQSSIGPNALNRALTIDPDNTAAWSRRCTSYVGKDSAERLNDCRQAVALHATAANYRGQAAALEETGDACGAEASYREALSKPDVFSQRAYVMRDQARAALACGDPNGSLTALQSAEALDLRTGPLTSEGLAADRGYMAVVYSEMNNPEKAAQMCAAANPGYASCTCQLTGTGLVCSQAVSEQAAR